MKVDGNERMAFGVRLALRNYKWSIDRIEQELKRVAVELIKDGADPMEVVRRLTLDGTDPTDLMFQKVLGKRESKYILGTDPDYLSWTKRMYQPVFNLIDYGGLLDRYYPEPEIRLEERREY